MPYALVLIVVLLSGGCAKHGLMMETGKDFKGTIALGWGPMNIFNSDVAGASRICVPSETALQAEDQSQNWCRSWMVQPASLVDPDK